MFSLAVLENRDEKIAATIVRALKKHSREREITVMVSRSDDYEFLHGEDIDLLIISPKGSTNTQKTLTANCILLPGGLLGNLSSISTEYVITYGMSPRDTITASSISEDGVVISFQRELVTLDGKVLERQELPLVRVDGFTAEQIMIVKGALLLLGLPTECVSSE